MKEFFEKGITFIKKNPTILYSLLLIIVMVGIIFINAYYSLQKFQSNVDAILQSKAVLAEDIFGVAIESYMNDSQLLQQKIDKIKSQDSEIQSISILVPTEKIGEFNVVASTESGAISQIETSDLSLLAWQHQEEGIAYLSNDGNARYWTVMKSLRDAANEKKGIIAMSVSLKENDAFIRKTISSVYISALFSMIIVLLLVLNHIRLFKFAAKAVKLEEIDKMKDDFISMASHELKSPLTAIRGYTDLLTSDDFKIADVKQEGDRKKYLKNMNDLTVRLVDLIEDILEVSRIEQNRLPITMEKMELSELLNSVVDQFDLIAKEKNLYIKSDISSKYLVAGDQQRVRQILTNLISNAIKYTIKGGVEITIKEDSAFAYVTIADTGLGMSAESMKNLFTKFYRIQTDQTASISGTGLGLWISKEIATKMGGDIDVESIEGVGTHFILKLKKA